MNCFATYISPQTVLQLSYPQPMEQEIGDPFGVLGRPWESQGSLLVPWVSPWGSSGVPGAVLEGSHRLLGEDGGIENIEGFVGVSGGVLGGLLGDLGRLGRSLGATQRGHVDVSLMLLVYLRSEVVVYLQIKQNGYYLV